MNDQFLNSSEINIVFDIGIAWLVYYSHSLNQ